jgi:endonuclease YncB( thermonuclease family)
MASIPNIQWSDTIPFIPPIYSGFVIKVYDGDTITIASKMPFNDSPMFRFSVRLAGIDSPEINSKSIHEKNLAILSKNALSNLLLNKYIELKNISLEKYGRLLADIYLNHIHINSWMLENNFAIPYDGKTKTKPIEWTNDDI